MDDAERAICAAIEGVLRIRTSLLVRTQYSSSPAFWIWHSSTSCSGASHCDGFCTVALWPILESSWELSVRQEEFCDKSSELKGGLSLRHICSLNSGFEVWSARDGRN